MGCFRACFRHPKHKKSMKNLQDQCWSRSEKLHESEKLLPATMEMESLKEKEIVNPIQESDKGHSNLSAKMDETEKERIEDKDDESESKFVQEEECSDSLFSLSIGVFAEDKEVNSPLLTSCHDDEDKQNVGLHKDHPMIITKQSNGELSDDCTVKKKRESELAVDTSLSSWFLVSEKLDSSPQSENNYVSGEREELKGILSPCCSGDDQLGIGTVGGYWWRRAGASCKGVSTVSTKLV